MRKQLVKTIEKILNDDEKSILMLGDIGVFGFRNSFKNHPKRVYNIGILEQSTVGLASGLSITGFIPFIHTIAPFLVERSLEQLKIDFGYQNLGGNFISIGASYDYAGLGSTHHCPGDVQQLLTIPNMEIIIPGTSQELDTLMNQSYNNGNPTYYRLSEYENEISCDVNIGKANIVKKGSKATIICVGNTLQNVIESTQEMDVTILYYTTINPFDSELLLQNFNEKIIVVEPYYKGGMNFKITESLKNKKYTITNIGVPHMFLTNYGNKKEHDTKLGLDKEGIKKTLLECLS
jgi:transketolase